MADEQRRLSDSGLGSERLRIVPVDVYVPACPPRPEALLEGITRRVGTGAESGR